jgi:hypothetical protein
MPADRSSDFEAWVFTGSKPQTGAALRPVLRHEISASFVALGKLPALARVVCDVGVPERVNAPVRLDTGSLNDFLETLNLGNPSYEDMTARWSGGGFTAVAVFEQLRRGDEFLKEFGAERATGRPGTAQFYLNVYRDADGELAETLNAHWLQPDAQTPGYALRTSACRILANSNRETACLVFQSGSNHLWIDLPPRVVAANAQQTQQARKRRGPWLRRPSRKGLE